LDRFSWGDLLMQLERTGNFPINDTLALSNMSEPHVLIVDEINRGNISRIFGELITLIEPSKRSGANEALEVVLPYSKKSFNVPSNVYLIGTMNTADRTLTSLDIALRRRFTFKEMSPRPELLDDIIIKEGVIQTVNIGDMLRKMNERIKVLLDQDHCIGHAYFMPLKDDCTLVNLAFIFRQQILPLLQEYFFEDWERIAWILNDQNKSPEFSFVHEMRTNLALLFDSTIASSLQNSNQGWYINESAFSKIESYQYIIGNIK
jgi:5-methylcytosine-specific restriction enzyme B